MLCYTLLDTVSFLPAVTLTQKDMDSALYFLVSPRPGTVPSTWYTAPYVIFFFFELNWIMKCKGGEEQVFQNRRQEIRPTKSGSPANSRHPSIVGGFFVQRAGNWALRTTQPLPLWPIASDCGLWSQLCWNARPATFCVIAGKLLNFPYLGFSSVKPGQRWSLIIKSCHENKWKGPCGALRLVPGRGSVG